MGFEQSYNNTPSLFSLFLQRLPLLFKMPFFLLPIKVPPRVITDNDMRLHVKHEVI